MTDRFRDLGSRIVNLTPPATTPTKDSPSDLWQEIGGAVNSLAADIWIPTGIEPIDRQLRNRGIPPGRIVVIGGPPFAGKTTLAIEIALNMAAGVPVYALFSDEGRAQAAVRLAVMLGIPLADIDADPATASVKASELIGERAIFMLKPDTPYSHASYIVEHAVSRAAPRGTLIALDSVQTIRARQSEDDDEEQSPRIAAKQLVTACRGWADAHGFNFLLTSQANRGAYKSKNEGDNVHAIAAFSESSAIEYMADVAIVLGLPDEKTGVVKVKFVKNRLKGTAKGFALKYEPETGRLCEQDPAEAEAADREAAIARLAPARTACIVELERRNEGLTSNQIVEVSGKRKADIIAALRVLESERRAYCKPDGRRFLWYLVAGR